MMTFEEWYDENYDDGVDAEVLAEAAWDYVSGEVEQRDGVIANSTAQIRSLEAKGHEITDNVEWLLGWFNQPTPKLDGLSPLDALRQGNGEDLGAWLTVEIEKRS